jgi:hypothetical protein
MLVFQGGYCYVKWLWCFLWVDGEGNGIRGSVSVKIALLESNERRERLGWYTWKEDRGESSRCVAFHQTGDVSVRRALYRGLG